MIRDENQQRAFFKEIFAHGATEEQAIQMCGLITQQDEIKEVMSFMQKNPEATVHEIAMRHREFLGYDK